MFLLLIVVKNCQQRNVTSSQCSIFVHHARANRTSEREKFTIFVITKHIVFFLVKTNLSRNRKLGLILLFSYRTDLIYCVYSFSKLLYLEWCSLKQASPPLFGRGSGACSAKRNRINKHCLMQLAR